MTVALIQSQSKLVRRVKSSKKITDEDVPYLIIVASEEPTVDPSTRLVHEPSPHSSINGA